MGKLKNILLYCEDAAHKTFVYNCLKQLNVTNLNHCLVDFTASKEFVGGNRNTVIERVKNEFPAWKSKNKTHKILLIVVLDADDDDIEDLKNKLPQAVEDANRSLYVHIIPKRNVQTWVKLGMAANGKDEEPLPDEISDYKSNATKSDAQAREAAEILMKVYIKGENDAKLHLNPVWKTFEQQMNVLKDALNVLKS